MPGGRGRKHFIPMDTTPTFVRNMLLGLDMSNQVDQSFVKVYFPRMIVEYSNWLVSKIRDKENDIASMRKQFLEDNQGKKGDKNYEYKRRDKDDEVLTIDGTNEQLKKKKLKRPNFFFFCFEHVYLKS